MKDLKNQLETKCELHFWTGLYRNKKKLSFKGDLGGLLKESGVKFSKRKTKAEGIYAFTFKNDYGITYKATGLISDFSYHAKKFIQMELVRMGDKSQLYVANTIRPIVNVNM